MLSSKNSDDTQNFDLLVFKATFDSLTNHQPKFAQVESNELEQTEKLKNYATVNVAEPIQTQLSYNIGTENVENVETLNSVIAEIENETAVTLYDEEMQYLTSHLYEGDNLSSQPNADSSGNLNIINVQTVAPPAEMVLPEPSTEVVDLNKRNHALEVSDHFTGIATTLYARTDLKFPTYNIYIKTIVTAFKKRHL